MNQSERMEIARRAVEQDGQAGVARRIGKSPATVSLVLAGKYGGNPDIVLELIASEYGDETTDCPIMGVVSLADCIEARRRAELPFFPSSGQSTELYRTCPECRHNGGKS